MSNVLCFTSRFSTKLQTNTLFSSQVNVQNLLKISFLSLTVNNRHFLFFDLLQVLLHPLGDTILSFRSTQQVLTPSFFDTHLYCLPSIRSLLLTFLHHSFFFLFLTGTVSSVFSFSSIPLFLSSPRTRLHRFDCLLIHRFLNYSFQSNSGCCYCCLHPVLESNLDPS